MSIGRAGAEANGDSDQPAISGDGRLVAFSSLATNLVPGDTNGDPSFFTGRDVFVRDRVAGTTERVSIGSAGQEGDGGSTGPALSADGRFVAFASLASTLVPGDTNGFPGDLTGGDVFVRDRRAGTTERVSVSSAGAQGMGRFGSFEPAISGDGGLVAFESDASNLVPGDTNGAADVFVHDRVTGTTERVSVGPGGRQANGGSVAPAISRDGRFVAFSSGASNLVAGDDVQVDVFVHDRVTGTTEKVSTGLGGAEGDAFSDAAALGADGRFVAFHADASNLVAGDTNDVTDVFVHARGAAPVRCAGRTATITGTPGGETVTGTPGADVIAARGGADAIRARGGRDVVCAGRGADAVSGGGAADRLLGGAGVDALHAESGADRLRGGGGADLLFGDLGDDVLAGAAGDDLLHAGPGDDVLAGGAGDDRCNGGAGVDAAAACERLLFVP